MASKRIDPVVSYFELLRIIESEFQLKDSYLKEDVPTFIIVPGPNVREKTERLRAKLHERGLELVLRQRNNELVLTAVTVRPTLRPQTDLSRLRLPIILFVATVITVTISGYLSASNHIQLLKILGRLSLSRSQENTFRLELTLLYTISVMGVLGLHELGHIIACRIHRMKASLPLFIPGIPGVGLGTFGAVIRQESPVLNRNQLFDIGFMGPFFGFVAALIVSYFGYSWSLPVTEIEYMRVIGMMGPGRTIFMPAIFMIFNQYIFPNPNSYTHFLHPIAMAGWVCTLITFLNAFPIGQLDGGHISRALLGRKWHQRLSYIMPGVMVMAGWWTMALFAFFLIRTSHPGTLDDVSKTSKNRKIAGVFFILLFLACFTISPESPLMMLLLR